MPFQKGNSEWRKRGVTKGGPPTTTQREIRKAAREIARQYIEDHIEPVLQNYLKLAQGYYETRYTQDGNSYEVFVPDGPTTRHFVDKLLPEINVDGAKRPIAIQVVVEGTQAQGVTVRASAGGDAGSEDLSVEGAGNRRSILIGSE